MFLNYSRASLFWSCRRKWALTHLLRLRPAMEYDNFNIGTAVHAGLALHYGGVASDLDCAKKASDTYLDLRRAHWNGLELTEWQEQADYINKLVTSYMERVEPVDDFKVVAAERPFAVRLGEICWQCSTSYSKILESERKQFCPTCGASIHYWVGTIDLEVEHNGEPAILDHKTTGSTPGDDFMNGWARSFQLIGYAYGAAKSLGREVREYGVNALQKAKTIGEEIATLKVCPACKNGKVKKLECIECGGVGKIEKLVPLQPFRRRWFPLFPGDIDRFVAYSQSTIMEIENETKRLAVTPIHAFPMNDKMCRGCQFVPICWGGQPANQWNHPVSIELEGLIAGEPDYVDKFEVVSREEM